MRIPPLPPGTILMRDLAIAKALAIYEANPKDPELRVSIEVAVGITILDVLANHPELCP